MDKMIIKKLKAHKLREEGERAYKIGSRFDPSRPKHGSSLASPNQNTDLFNQRHMAVNRLQHFADPHMLLRTEYNSMASHTCDVCQSKLAGLVGYRCNACNFDVHVACADYFKETVSFLAHPLAHPRAKPHTLLDGSAR
jgi:hypothetical protein